jgi:hypothetical protein
MKKETWEFWKFHLMLGIKSAPRIFVAPFVGAVRGMLAEAERIDADLSASMAAFDARQLKAREGGGAPDADSREAHA